MNDDELTDALRRMLRGRAGRLRPNRGTPPQEGQMPAPAPRPDPWFRRARALTGLVAVAGAAAVIAAVVAVTGGSGSSGSSRAVHTRTATAPTALPGPTVTPATTIPSVAPAAVDPTTTTAAPTTTTPPPPAVPTGFQPLSATFVSTREGWVLGGAPCASGSCPALTRTTDGGATWAAATAPALDLTAGLERVGIRFADTRDGWAFTPDQLWSTHDGGATWHHEALPGGPGSIGDLEASGATAYLAVLRAGHESIYSTPVAADSWTASGATPLIGAGPVPLAQIVLQGGSGWIINNNRVVVSGAREQAGAAWAPWTPPCKGANGSGGLAASSPTDLVAWCTEGTWGPPQPGTTQGQVWLMRSSDAGSTFSQVAPLPASIASLSTAPGQPDLILAVSAGGILRSTDGGSTWSTVYRAAGGVATAASFVGFTTAGQAVAVVDHSVVMTRNGGATWSAVKF